MEDDWEGLDEAFLELEEELTHIVSGIVVQLWDSVLRLTPQFYGRMAASWTYSVGAPQYVDRSDMVDVAALEGGTTRNNKFGEFLGWRRGHPAAIAIANTANVGHDEQFRLGDTIYLSNGVDHGEGSYSQDIEDGNVRLRPVNLPGAPMARSLALIEARYGDDVSYSAANILKTLRIGVTSAS